MKRQDAFLLVLAAVLILWLSLCLSKVESNLYQEVTGFEEQVAVLHQSLDSLRSQAMLTAYFLRESDTVWFAGERLPLERPLVKERFQAELWFLLQHRGTLLVWWQRLGRYIPLIEAELKRRGLPEDFKWLFLWESGLDPRATSYRGAVGISQFTAPTSARYGLRKDAVVDERRDPFLAIPAAVKHLKKLSAPVHWPLVLAAYNMGELGLYSLLQQQGTKDYFKLKLPLETERYVYAVVALKWLYDHRAFTLPGLEQVPQLPPLVVKQAKVRLKTEGTLSELARLSKMELGEFLLLNPKFRGTKPTPGTYLVWVPVPNHGS